MKLILKQITQQLLENATNYSVSFQVYDVQLTNTSNPNSVIKSALGPEAVLGDIHEVQGDAAWREVETALLYAGDDGSGPSSSVLASEAFATLVHQLKNEFFQLVKVSSKIEKFWLQEGHPAYPVFWDFAFLFWHNQGVTILIGSSSD